jgi:hypothetical protein
MMYIVWLLHTYILFKNIISFRAHIILRPKYIHYVNVSRFSEIYVLNESYKHILTCPFVCYFLQNIA